MAGGGDYGASAPWTRGQTVRHQNRDTSRHAVRRDAWGHAPRPADASLWRYLDFTKFVSLLDTSELFFARADTLGDEFEGGVASAPSREARSPQFAPQLAEMKEGVRRHTYINCWSLAEHESAALWGLYTPTAGGVAVRTTFQRLTGSIKDEGRAQSSRRWLCRVHRSTGATGLRKAT